MEWDLRLLSDSYPVSDDKLTSLIKVILEEYKCFRVSVVYLVVSKLIVHTYYTSEPTVENISIAI